MTLRMSHGLTTSHPVHKAMQFVASRALEKSNSTLLIEIFPNEQLGTERESIRKLQIGAFELTKVSSGMLEAHVDEYKVFALPYLFKNNEHKWRVLDGVVGQRVLASGQKNRLKGLAYYDGGARSFYTIDQPILHPNDLNGLKIRTQQSDMAIRLVEILGSSASPISFGKVLKSLQDGQVDGAENNPPSLYTSGHFEVSKHYSLDEHTSVPSVIVISTPAWNRLSAAHKKALLEAAQEWAKFQRKLWSEFEQESMDKMVAAGLQVHHPDKTPFRERGMELWQEYEGTVVGDLAKEIQAIE